MAPKRSSKKKKQPVSIDASSQAPLAATQEKEDGITNSRQRPQETIFTSNTQLELPPASQLQSDDAYSQGVDDGEEEAVPQQVSFELDAVFTPEGPATDGSGETYIKLAQYALQNVMLGSSIFNSGAVCFFENFIEVVGIDDSANVTTPMRVPYLTCVSFRNVKAQCCTRVEIPFSLASEWAKENLFELEATAGPQSNTVMPLTIQFDDEEEFVHFRTQVAPVLSANHARARSASRISMIADPLVVALGPSQIQTTTMNTENGDEALSDEEQPTNDKANSVSLEEIRAESTQEDGGSNQSCCDDDELSESRKPIDGSCFLPPLAPQPQRQLHQQQQQAVSSHEQRPGPRMVGGHVDSPYPPPAAAVAPRKMEVRSAHNLHHVETSEIVGTLTTSHMKATPAADDQDTNKTDEHNGATYGNGRVTKRLEDLFSPVEEAHDEVLPEHTSNKLPHQRRQNKHNKSGIREQEGEDATDVGRATYPSTGNNKNGATVTTGDQVGEQLSALATPGGADGGVLLLKRGQRKSAPTTLSLGKTKELNKKKSTVSLPEAETSSFHINNGEKRPSCTKEHKKKHVTGVCTDGDIFEDTCEVSTVTESDSGRGPLTEDAPIIVKPAMRADHSREEDEEVSEEEDEDISFASLLEKRRSGPDRDSASKKRMGLSTALSTSKKKKSQKRKSCMKSPDDDEERTAKKRQNEKASVEQSTSSGGVLSSAIKGSAAGSKRNSCSSTKKSDRKKKQISFLYEETVGKAASPMDDTSPSQQGSAMIKRSPVDGARDGLQDVPDKPHKESLAKKKDDDLSPTAAITKSAGNTPFRLTTAAPLEIGTGDDNGSQSSAFDFDVDVIVRKDPSVPEPDELEGREETNDSGRGRRKKKKKKGHTEEAPKNELDIELDSIVASTQKKAKRSTKRGGGNSAKKRTRSSAAAPVVTPATGEENKLNCNLNPEDAGTPSIEPTHEEGQDAPAGQVDDWVPAEDVADELQTLKFRKTELLSKEGSGDAKNHDGMNLCDENELRHDNTIHTNNFEPYHHHHHHHRQQSNNNKCSPLTRNATSTLSHRKLLLAAIATPATPHPRRQQSQRRQSAAEKAFETRKKNLELEEKKRKDAEEEMMQELRTLLQDNGQNGEGRGGDPKEGKVVRVMQTAFAALLKAQYKSLPTGESLSEGEEQATEGNGGNRKKEKSPCCDPLCLGVPKADVLRLINDVKTVLQKELLSETATYMEKVSEIRSRMFKEEEACFNEHVQRTLLSVVGCLPEVMEMKLRNY